MVFTNTIVFHSFSFVAQKKQNALAPLLMVSLRFDN